MNNNSNINDSIALCEDAAKIQGTYQMKIILILECLFGVAATVPNLASIVLLFRVEVFHSNLRVLLGFLSLDLFVYSVTLAEKAFRRLVTPVCQLPILFRTCVVHDWAIGIPLHNAVMSLMILFLERLYAALRFRGYDGFKRKPYLALLLLVCSWTSTLFIQLTNYAKSPPDAWVAVCDTAILLKPSQLVTVIATFVSLEILGVWLMLFVYAYNRFMMRRTVINRAQFDLSSRFQVDQNVKIDNVLLPSMVLHVVCYLPNYTFLLLTFYDPLLLSLETKAWLLHLSYLWRLIYACLHPTLLITLNPNLKQGFCKTAVGRLLISLCTCGKMNKIRAVNTIHILETTDHFNHLNKMWASVEQKRKKKHENAHKIKF